ncbi:hypothetical protein [Isoptericola sp. BMS4]|uniref:hypothetical protein n=1 Tax=Isoptericola sp. BMS4 TaxID=2527875 RepID=UPI0014201E88|nr:hypothetical protein [Isoptericola sp. BMS4]
MHPTEFRDSRLKALGLAGVCLATGVTAAIALLGGRPGVFGTVLLVTLIVVATTCLVPLLLRAARAPGVALALDPEGFTYRGLRVGWHEVTGHTTHRVYRRGTVVVVHVADPDALAARWRAAGLHAAEHSIRTWGTPVVLDTAGLDASPRRVVSGFAERRRVVP